MWQGTFHCRDQDFVAFMAGHTRDSPHCVTRPGGTGAMRDALVFGPCTQVKP